MTNITDRIDRVLSGREDLVIRDFSPHFEGDWKTGTDYILGTIQKANRGETEQAQLSYDAETRTGKVFEPCGCCGKEAGFKFRFVSRNREGRNLAQL